MRFNCPACGAETDFKSKISVFAVCNYCQSMLIRHDLDLQNLGKMAALPDDITPLQIGTRGQVEGNHFELVGRLILSWAEGKWSEWFAVLNDGREGWLAEAQGFYMFSFRYSDPPPLPKLKEVSLGTRLTLKHGEIFEVEDIKNAICMGSEGELPFQAPQGRKSTSIDLVSFGQAFACLEYSNDEDTLLYVGKYWDFDSFQFSNLRKIDGW
jgi:hypothetical protein